MLSCSLSEPRATNRILNLWSSATEPNVRPSAAEFSFTDPEIQPVQLSASKNPLLAPDSYSPFHTSPPDPRTLWRHTVQPAPRFEPQDVDELATPVAKARFQSITAMPAYNHMSFEELRSEDYSLPNYRPLAPNRTHFGPPNGQRGAKRDRKRPERRVEHVNLTGINPFLKMFTSTSLPNPFIISLYVAPPPTTYPTFTNSLADTLADSDPARSGTSFHPYTITQEKSDSSQETLMFQSICAMKVYEGWSVEELRLKDYQIIKRHGNGKDDLVSLIARLDI